MKDRQASLELRQNKAIAHRKRIEDKTVFMSVAGTMNVFRAKPQTAAHQVRGLPILH